MKQFNQLSRAEMMNVKGGVAQPGVATCAFFGSCNNWPSIGQYNPDQPIQAGIAQYQADKFCEKNACCTNADCPGAPDNV